MLLCVNLSYHHYQHLTFLVVLLTSFGTCGNLELARRRSISDHGITSHTTNLIDSNMACYSDVAAAQLTLTLSCLQAVGCLNSKTIPSKRLVPYCSTHKVQYGHIQLYLYTTTQRAEHLSDYLLFTSACECLTHFSPVDS